MEKKKWLTATEVLHLFNSRGISTSKSTLYRHTISGFIPYSTAKNELKGVDRNYFLYEEDNISSLLSYILKRRQNDKKADIAMAIRAWGRLSILAEPPAKNISNTIKKRTESLKGAMEAYLEDGEVEYYSPFHDKWRVTSAPIWAPGIEYRPKNKMPENLRKMASDSLTELRATAKRIKNEIDSRYYPTIEEAIAAKKEYIPYTKMEEIPLGELVRLITLDMPIRILFGTEMRSDGHIIIMAGGYSQYAEEFFERWLLVKGNDDGTFSYRPAGKLKGK